MSKLIELQQELESVQNAMHYHTRHGGLKEDAEYKEWEQQEADILSRMDTARREEANEAIEDDYRNNDKPYIISVEGEDINLRDYMSNEQAYQFIAIALSKRDYEKDETHNSVVIELTNGFEVERQQFRDQITNANATADAKYNELYEQFHDLKNENADKDRRLLAASSEIEVLKQQLEVRNKVEAPKPTNIDSDLAEARRKANEAKRAIYNVEKDRANINYTARFLDNDEEFTDKVIYIGKYRIADDAEVQRFWQERETINQAQLESAASAEIVVESVSPPAPPVRFPDDAVPEYTPDRTVDEEATRSTFGTIEERIAALELQVFGHVKAVA